jgi:hypothetical protein
LALLLGRWERIGGMWVEMYMIELAGGRSGRVLGM